MSEINDNFAVMKEQSQVKRSYNRTQSAKLLRDNSVWYDTKNAGAHLIVRHAGHIVDFWPGTGKYIVRNGPEGRGIFNLLRFLGVDIEA